MNGFASLALTRMSNGGWQLSESENNTLIWLEGDHGPPKEQITIYGRKTTTTGVSITTTLQLQRMLHENQFQSRHHPFDLVPS